MKLLIQFTAIMLGSLKYNLVDDLIYEDQLDSIIRKNIGRKNEEKIHKISFKKYLKEKQQKSYMAKSNLKKGNIAVVYAVGDIISGESSRRKYGFGYYS
jgi:ClpP class serine protease